jgi:hypothetical protein
MPTTRETTCINQYLLLLLLLLLLLFKLCAIIPFFMHVTTDVPVVYIQNFLFLSCTECSLFSVANPDNLMFVKCSTVSVQEGFLMDKGVPGYVFLPEILFSSFFPYHTLSAQYSDFIYRRYVDLKLTVF